MSAIKLQVENEKNSLFVIDELCHTPNEYQLKQFGAEKNHSSFSKNNFDTGFKTRQM
jgi:hypothetical protein